MRYQCFDRSLAKEIASELLKIAAIKLEPNDPFTWASGWKSPIYCDNRLSLSHPETRTMVKNALARLIKEKYPEVEAIAGVATAGIPQGVLVADLLEVPFIYVRSSSKSHGLTNQIEGKVIKGQKVVVLEDLVSSGGSSLAAVDALRNAGVEILGMTSIFNYGFDIAKSNFDNKQVDLVYLSEYSILIELALSEGYISADMKEELDSWRTNPSGWRA